MKRKLFAIGLPPGESHALRLSTLNQPARGRGRQERSIISPESA